MAGDLKSSVIFTFPQEKKGKKRKPCFSAPSSTANKNLKVRFVNIWEIFRIKLVIKINLRKENGIHTERMTLILSIFPASAEIIQPVYFYYLNSCLINLSVNVLISITLLLSMAFRSRSVSNILVL